MKSTKVFRSLLVALVIVAQLISSTAFAVSLTEFTNENLEGLPCEVLTKVEQANLTLEKSATLCHVGDKTFLVLALGPTRYVNSTYNFKLDLENNNVAVSYTARNCFPVRSKDLFNKVVVLSVLDSENQVQKVTLN